ncbi:MAG: hypothetical protein PHD20_02875 [Clostridia bacterium]|nr:hypothetical protein [Clostridia bacterium]
MEKQKFYLDPSSRYNHGCSDFAVLEDNQDGTATVIKAESCHSCWQVGHDQDHIYYEIGDIVTIENIMTNPDLVQDEVIIL